MAIKGVSDRNSVAPRFKVIGKLKKGSPKENGRVGADLDYFRFDSNDPLVLQAFEGIYGPEPRRLDVYLPYRNMEDNFSSWRELYGQNGLCKVRCDGENWVDWIDGPRHYHGERPCTWEFRDPASRCPGCPLQPVGRLSVILPEMWHAGHIGLVTVETHSWNDIANLSSKLVQWEPLTGKPFTLWREDTRIGVPIKDKRAAVEKSLIYVELTNDYLVALLRDAQRKALEDVNLPLLSEPSGGEAHADGDAGTDEPGPRDARADDFVTSAPPVEDATYEEAPDPEAPEPEPAAEAANGRRPWSAEQVIAKIVEIVEAKGGKGAAASDKQRGLIAAKLEECFAGDDDASTRRHTVLKAIFGFDSVKLLTKAQAGATLQWLLAGGQDDTGDYPLHEAAPKEAAAIVRQALIDAGQEELPMPLEETA